jgi:hypothetical protein
MATLTSTVFEKNQPKHVHKGNVTVSGQWAAAVAASTGDIVFLAKIPHGATIVEFAVDHSSSGTLLGCDYGLASGLKAGGGAQMSIFATALAKATIIRKNLQNAQGVDNIQISCSASDPGRYGIFAAKIGTSGTTLDKPIINFSITYRNDDNQGL